MARLDKPAGGSMITLYGRSAKDLTLSEALQQSATLFTQTIALLYSPALCQFATFSEGNLYDEDLEIIDLTTVYEARVFSEKGELRWLNNSDGVGRAVLLSEEPLSDHFSLEVDLENLHSIDQTYLLWGKGISTNTQTGWSQIGKSRVGTISIPFKGVRSGMYVCLNAREYLQEVDQHGNVSVVEERLIGLSVMERNNGQT
jgi:CRISPR-associated protein (TIGR03984 family)